MPKILLNGGEIEYKTKPFFEERIRKNPDKKDKKLFRRINQFIGKTNSWFIASDHIGFCPVAPVSFCHNNCKQYQFENASKKYFILQGWQVVLKIVKETGQTTLIFVWHSNLWKPSFDLLDITIRPTYDSNLFGICYLGFIPATKGADSLNYSVDFHTGTTIFSWDGFKTEIELKDLFQQKWS